MNGARLSIFRHLFSSVAEEMGVTLERAAYSPNIKERLDFSCALFLGDGRILAQAAHIPVHLGAMPASVSAAINHCSPFKSGDLIILNDPYLGGTHLPDITLVSPVFNSDDSAPESKIHTSLEVEDKPQFFVASRAHHSDVGGMSPGSMPLSNELYQEGLIIPPLKLVDAGKRNDALWQLILRNVRTPMEREGDLAAQLAAHVIGSERINGLVSRYGVTECLEQAENLISYASNLTREIISNIPDGRYEFNDFLDDDGIGQEPVTICLSIEVVGSSMTFDFAGTDPAVDGNVNAVPAIASSAISYCLRCLSRALIQVDLPMNAGVYEPWQVAIEPGSLLDPDPPHAVSAGNVETSQRLVDVIFGALSSALPNIIPAASQGTMNNLAFGSKPAARNLDRLAEIQDEHPHFAYYETIGGGIGASRSRSGGSGMHAHMSNTRNTPVEALEYQFPITVNEYALRAASGGSGIQSGGEGLVRAIQFHEPAAATIVSERRRWSPYGLQGGKPGSSGRNELIRGKEKILLPGKVSTDIQRGDILVIETPGGGGWGSS